MGLRHLYKLLTKPRSKSKPTPAPNNSLGPSLPSRSIMIVLITANGYVAAAQPLHVAEEHLLSEDVLPLVSSQEPSSNELQRTSSAVRTDQRRYGRIFDNPVLGSDAHTSCKG